MPRRRAPMSTLTTGCGDGVSAAASGVAAARRVNSGRMSPERCPAFVVAYSASGLHRELNRVKERSHEGMAPSRFRGVPGTDLPVFRQGFRQTRRPARQGRRGPHYRPKVRLKSQPWHIYSGVIARCILAASTLEGGKTAAKSVMAVAAHREEFEFDHHCSGPNLDVTSNDIIRRIERYSA